MLENIQVISTPENAVLIGNFTDEQLIVNGGCEDGIKKLFTAYLCNIQPKTVGVGKLVLENSGIQYINKTDKRKLVLSFNVEVYYNHNDSKPIIVTDEEYISLGKCDLWHKNAEELNNALEVEKENFNAFIDMLRIKFESIKTETYQDFTK